MKIIKGTGYIVTHTYNDTIIFDFFERLKQAKQHKEFLIERGYKALISNKVDLKFKNR